MCRFAQFSKLSHYAACSNVELLCQVAFSLDVMLSVKMLSDGILNVVILNVVKLNVIMLIAE